MVLNRTVVVGDGGRLAHSGGGVSRAFLAGGSVALDSVAVRRVVVTLWAAFVDFAGAGALVSSFFEDFFMTVFFGDL